MKVKADRDEASPYAAMLAAQVMKGLNFFRLCSTLNTQLLNKIANFSLNLFDENENQLSIS